MVESRQDLIFAIENCLLQTLDANKGKSNVKTSHLHGAVEKYINQRHQLTWDHEYKISGNDQSFKMDIHAKSQESDLGLSLKMPARSLLKNKKNLLTHTWGEAVRVSLIRKGKSNPMRFLSIHIYPTTDIVVSEKNQRGDGKTEFKPYSADSPETYNAGYELVRSQSTAFRYVAIPCNYRVSHTLKRLSRVRTAFAQLEAGHRISVDESTWDDFDDAVDWLLKGIVAKTA